ncbi:helix-turn-helix domain-containing protein [Paenibacillus chartarius]|uniref:Helix-turn-helix domain-containing protein n=1 Tax=Paenibacillus chartarius TaxID=747481 RepID=A0ABV6DFG6_9BACL
MAETDLFELVQRAKHGDRESLGEIITMFQPAIKKACSRVKPQERYDLEQIISEKVIKAIINYEMDSIPDYSGFIDMITSRKGSSKQKW